MSVTGDVLEPWFVRDPQRLQDELQAFTDRGLKANKTMAAGDIVSITTALPYGATTVPVEVRYPFDFPDQYPLFVGPPALLPRHQGDAFEDFCWSGDAVSEWRPGTHAAAIVDRNIRALLADSAAGADVVAANEMPIPEPVSAWMSESVRAVAVPDPFLAPELRAATGEMRLYTAGTGERRILAFAEGIGHVDPTLLDRFGTTSPGGSAWWMNVEARDHEALKPGGEERLSRLVGAAVPEIRRYLAKRLGQNRKSGHTAVSCSVGFTFTEEGPGQGQFRRNWAFGTAKLTRTARNTGGLPTVEVIAEAHALTREERQRRIPELAGLEDARVIAIGAGSVGSQLVLELVKAGVGHTDVVDNDAMDVNNTVRHALTTWDDGAHKADALVQRAQLANPFVDIVGHTFTVGARNSGRHYSQKLRELVEDADVVVDTTGSQVVARILQRHCIELDVTLVVAGLSTGSHGADVAVFPPDPHRACFDCLVLAQSGEAPAIANPHAGGTALLTPRGCAHPAFTGAGFDATALAALAARVTVQATRKSDYPASRFDWVVTNFRGTDPWQSGWLDPHPDCQRDHVR